LLVLRKSGMPTPSEKPSATARRRRKADQRRVAAEGDRADRRGEFCWRWPGECLPCDRHLPAHTQLPGQIVPSLADQGLFIGSESSFYRVLHHAGQCHRRGRARLPQEPRAVPRLRADGPNQVWSWDIGAYQERSPLEVPI